MKIVFLISKQVKYGQVVLIVGSHFGDWDVKNGIELSWSDGHVWGIDVNVDKDTTRLDYKYVVVTQSDRSIVEWENGPNRKIDKFKNQKHLQKDHWNLRKVKLELLHNPMQPYKINFLRIHERVQMIPFKNLSKATFFMGIEQLQKGLIYLYSDHNQKWERGGVRTLSLLEKSTDKGSLKIINNVIYKTDRCLDFELNYNQVTDSITVGSYIWDEKDINQLHSEQITAILNLQTTDDLARRGLDTDRFTKLSQLCAEKNIVYLNYSITDQNDDHFYQKGLKAQQLLKRLIDSGLKVYVHCTAGVQRSVQTVILYLVLNQNYSLDQAVKMVKTKRPQSSPNQHLLQRQIDSYIKQCKPYPYSYSAPIKLQKTLST